MCLLSIYKFFCSVWVRVHTVLYGKRLISKHRKRSLWRKFSMHSEMKQMHNEHFVKSCCFGHCAIIQISFNSTAFTGMLWFFFFFRIGFSVCGKFSCEKNWSSIITRKNVEFSLEKKNINSIFTWKHMIQFSSRQRILNKIRIGWKLKIFRRWKKFDWFKCHNIHDETFLDWHFAVF